MIDTDDVIAKIKAKQAERDEANKEPSMEDGIAQNRLDNAIERSQKNRAEQDSAGLNFEREQETHENGVTDEYESKGKDVLAAIRARQNGTWKQENKCEEIPEPKRDSSGEEMLQKIRDRLKAGNVDPFDYAMEVVEKKQ